MITFIRHAQSKHNYKAEQYRNSRKGEWEWDSLSKDEYYLNEIKYSLQLLDASITEKGEEEVMCKIMQCRIARKKIEHLKPDLILVSPLNRALETCSIIFEGTSCPIIAEPLLAEALRSACDFGSQTQPKRFIFPHINFDKVEKEGPFWFINNQSQQTKAKYFQIIDKYINAEFCETIKQILTHTKKTFAYELSSNILKRTEYLKQLLRQYGKYYKNIVVISHYNIIRFALAREFDENHEPFHCQMANCDIMQIQLNDL